MGKPLLTSSMEDIKNAIDDTVEITKVIKPVYNYKAGGE
jgi:hypothetical protein